MNESQPRSDDLWHSIDKKLDVVIDRVGTISQAVAKLEQYTTLEDDRLRQGLNKLDDRQRRLEERILEHEGRWTQGLAIPIGTVLSLLVILIGGALAIYQQIDERINRHAQRPHTDAATSAQFKELNNDLRMMRQEMASKTDLKELQELIGRNTERILSRSSRTKPQ